jgi:putative Mg2+ transporter-C (MgtC) family protein
MNIGVFALRFSIAILLGALIGLERQWRQRMAGTRTHALVASGAAAFVMSGFLIQGDASGEARIVSYVISGIGFLGAGVIFKEHMQVQGLNTAATIWCSAAVGVVAGLGKPDYAAVIVVGVLATNTLLRPLAYKLYPRKEEVARVETNYCVEILCRTQDEARIRAVLFQTVSRLPANMYALKSEDLMDRIKIDADLRMSKRNDEALEQLVSRLSEEDSVSSLSWRVLPHDGAHQAEQPSPEDT